MRRCWSRVHNRGASPDSGTGLFNGLEHDLPVTHSIIAQLGIPARDPFGTLRTGLGGLPIARHPMDRTTRLCRAAAMSMLVSLSRRVTATPPLLPGSSRNWLSVWATHPLEVNAPTARPGRLHFCEGWRAAFCRVARHAPPRQVSPTCAVRLTGLGSGLPGRAGTQKVSESHMERGVSPRTPL
jgi:hypothetical protein